MDKLWVADTNTLLQDPTIIERYNIVILADIIRELEKHKLSYNKELSYNARKATRYINANFDKVHFDFTDYQITDERLDKNYVDNRIIEACKGRYGLITFDILLKFKAKGENIEVISEEPEPEKYDGHIEISLTKSELDEIYQHLDLNQWDLLENQYLIVKDAITGDVLDAFKWKNNSLHRVHEKGFKTNQFGKFSPYDVYQQCAVDSILNNQITSIKGLAGSGKSLISLYCSWHLMEKFKYDKLIIFTNPTKTRDAQELGFYKGTRTQKLLDSQIGIMLSSKLGDSMELELLINQGKLDLLPFSDIRGFDTTSEQKVIVWITEAQNLNTDLLKLGLQRIGSNTKVIVDGDPFAQVDKDIYRIDNGMLRMSEVFRGQDIYGEVTLNKVYRSKIAEIAEQM